SAVVGLAVDHGAGSDDAAAEGDVVHGDLVAVGAGHRGPGEVAIGVAASRTGLLQVGRGGRRGAGRGDRTGLGGRGAVVVGDGQGDVDGSGGDRLDDRRTGLGAELLEVPGVADDRAVDVARQ